jgi:hypothetical protein
MININEVIEAESQALLNTLTEHNFQYTFKKWQKRLGTMHTPGMGLPDGRCWPVDPKVVFDQIAASVLEIMDDSLTRIVGLEVLTAAVMKSIIFWDITNVVR